MHIIIKNSFNNKKNINIKIYTFFEIIEKYIPFKKKI